MKDVVFSSVLQIFYPKRQMLRRKTAENIYNFKFIGNFSSKGLIFFGLWYKIIRLELIFTKG